ncbi:MAG: hypothetical protein V1725_04225 [archaeon]
MFRKKQTDSKRHVETSLTLDYRSAVWGIERIVLDTIANHLPADSKGTKAAVKIKQQGTYRDISQSDFSQPAEEVVFEDDGQGYDSGLLTVLQSTKMNELCSVGQFGEGLKMVAAAALRNNLDLEYRSRDWSARPFIKEETIAGTRVKRLCFSIDKRPAMQGSQTIIRKPSPELMTELSVLERKALPFAEYKTLYTEPKGGKTYPARILELAKPALFVKGIRIQDRHSIFSYDLGIEDITPDRYFTKMDTLLDEIQRLLNATDNPEVIERVLAKAEDEPYGGYDEFRAFESREQERSGYFCGMFLDTIDPIVLLKSVGMKKTLFNALSAYIKEPIQTESVWKRSFTKLFGDNAILASDCDVTNKDAVALGYIPVKLHRGIAHKLIKEDVQSADQLEITKDYKWISKDDLTPEERTIYDCANEIQQVVLEQPVPVDLRVYSGVYANTGRELESNTGIYMPAKPRDIIGIKRSQLTDLVSFADTYLHELGHKVTGEGDYSRRHTAFFTRALAKLVSAQLGKHANL